MNNKEFDFNAGRDLKIGDFDYGTTLIKVKILSENYCCLIDKNDTTAIFTIWTDQESERVSIKVSSNATITRKVMNNINEISYAQSVLNDFRREGITSEFL